MSQLIARFNAIMKIRAIVSHCEINGSKTHGMFPFLTNSDDCLPIQITERNKTECVVKLAIVKNLMRKDAASYSFFSY